MNAHTLRILETAAAQLESAEFQRDQAASALQSLVLEAVGNGGTVVEVAEAAELPLEAVFAMCDQCGGGDYAGALVI